MSELRISRGRSSDARGLPSSLGGARGDGSGSGGRQQDDTRFGDLLREVQASDSVEPQIAIPQVATPIDPSRVDFGARVADAVVGAGHARAGKLMSLALGGSAESKNLVLRVEIDGDQVDIVGWAPDDAVLDRLLEVRDQLRQTLAERGLELRSIRLSTEPLLEEGEHGRQNDSSDRIMHTQWKTRRSFMEVIA